MYSYIVLLAILIVNAESSTEWSYAGENGPDYWNEIPGAYCGGDSQSPINLDPMNAMYQEFDDFKFVGYDVGSQDAGKPIILHNIGHSAQVDISGTYDLTGGGLQSTFKAYQYHFHWGSKDTIGSEHNLEGKPFAAEMHIVHFDSDKYADGDEAVADANMGIAALGVFLEIGDHNKAFDYIFDGLNDIQYKEQNVTLNDTFAVRDLLPTDLSTFYRYQGSLTTPACNEVVIWTVFKNAVTISKDQIDMLRKLHALKEEEEDSSVPHYIVDNFRPIQPLNGRTVYYSSSATMRGLSVFCIGLWTVLHYFVLP